MTPTEITEIERRIAEEVMGWPRIPGRLPRWYLGPQEDGAWDSDAWIMISHEPHIVSPDSRRSWSPWRNLTEAREVLAKLAVMVQQRTNRAPWVEISTCREQDIWNVWIGPFWETASGLHEGPAVCLLAEKILEPTPSTP